MKVSIADRDSNCMVHNATVRGEVFTPSSKFMTLEKKITDQEGQVVYSWSVDHNALRQYKRRGFLIF